MNIETEGPTVKIIMRSLGALAVMCVALDGVVVCGVIGSEIIEFAL